MASIKKLLAAKFMVIELGQMKCENPTKSIYITFPAYNSQTLFNKSTSNKCS